MVKISDVPTALKEADLKTRKKTGDSTANSEILYFPKPKLKESSFYFFFVRGGGRGLSKYLFHCSWLFSCYLW